MNLQVGQALASVVDTTTVIVIAAPAAGIALCCGGAEMVAGNAGIADGVLAPGHDGGSQLGKRYVAEALGLEVLCTKAGPGSLAADGTTLTLKEAKPLPASD